MAQTGESSDWFWLKGIPIVAFDRPRKEVILETASVVFLWFYHFATQFVALVFLVGGIKAEKAAVNTHTNAITIRGKCIWAIEISFKNFRIVSLDVLIGDDDFDLD